MRPLEPFTGVANFDIFILIKTGPFSRSIFDIFPRSILRYPTLGVFFGQQPEPLSTKNVKIPIERA